MKILSITLVGLCVFLCSCGTGRQEISVTIKQEEMCRDTIDIYYEVANTTSRRIWFCDDIGIDIKVDEIITFQGDRVYIDKKISALPEKMAFDKPVVARYILIDPGEKRLFKARLSTEEGYWSFMNDKNRLPLSAIKEIYLSIGYIDEALCRAYLAIEDNKSGDYDYELPVFISEMHHGIKYPKCLYITSMWNNYDKTVVDMYYEKTLDLVLDALKIRKGSTCINYTVLDEKLIEKTHERKENDE